MLGSPYRSRCAVPCRVILLVFATLAVLSAVGCGDSAEPSGPTVTQRITREFGRELIAAENAAPLKGHGTVLKLLREYERPRMTTIGREVESINGLNLEDWTWALNVNGIEADEQPGDYELYPGDVVQWDHRYWYVTLDVRATVGAFPDTFTRGAFGKRFPVTVECARPSASACREVEDALRDAGVAPDGSAPPGGLPPAWMPQRARVLVGPWRHWRGRAWPRRIDAGPGYSGVFARFSPAATELRFQNWLGHRQRTSGAGTGLVAAMRPTEQDLLWIVTGVDEVGVARAAKAFNRRDLRDAFAVAVTEEGVVKLPLPPR
jgi:hypothetical protein